MALPGRPKKDKQQASLACFYKTIAEREKRKHVEIQEERERVMNDIFGDGGEIDVDCGSNFEEVEEQPELLKKKLSRSWKLGWKIKHKWAFPIVVAKQVRIKCEYCVEYSSNNRNPFAKNGCCTLQLPALDQHSISTEHKRAELKWEQKHKRICIPLGDYVANMEDREKVRIITVMWQLYFVMKLGAPMEMFEALCIHQMEQGLANMLLQHGDYGTYVNRKSGLEFGEAIHNVLWRQLCKQIQGSLWYAILVDDSTDRGKEGHMIVYINYLRDEGKGDNHMAFVKLIKVEDSGAESKTKAIKNFIKEMSLSLERLVAVCTDGSSNMVGCRSGVTTRLKSEIPHLLSVHCLTHRENLAASQAMGAFPDLVELDRLCRSIYAWLHASGKRMDDFKLVEGALDILDLAMLQTHSIRWLSRGLVVEHMVKIMPTLLVEFGMVNLSIYQELIKYEVQFCIHLLAYICNEMNTLNRHFQADVVDIASISGYANAALRNLDRKFLRDSTDCGTKYLQQFVKKTVNMRITFKDATDEVHVHRLENTRGRTFEDCMSLTKDVVKKIKENLQKRMEDDIAIFDACKLFSLRHYPEDDEDLLEQKTDEWLTRLCTQFGNLVDLKRCKGELYSFLTVMLGNFRSKTFLTSWEASRSDITMIESFPNLIKLWEILAVIPVNTDVGSLVKMLSRLLIRLA